MKREFLLALAHQKSVGQPDQGCLSKMTLGAILPIEISSRQRHRRPMNKPFGLVKPEMEGFESSAPVLVLTGRVLP